MSVAFVLSLSFRAHANDGGISEKHFSRTARFYFPTNFKEVGVAGKSRTLVLFGPLAGTPLGIGTFTFEFADKLLVFCCRWR